MSGARKLVWSVTDAPMLESPDGGMRDTVMVTDDTCGARDVSAGQVWVKAGFEIHEDTHSFDEVYYVVAGRAQLILAGEPHEMKAGDIVYGPPEDATVGRTVIDTNFRSGRVPNARVAMMPWSPTGIQPAASARIVETITGTAAPSPVTSVSQCRDNHRVKALGLRL